MIVGIIGAMDVEVDSLKNLMSNPCIDQIGSVLYYKGEINGVECVVAVAGVGKVNAAVCAQTMILKYSPDVLINIGVAGGLDERLGVGDVVVAETVVEHDMDTTACGDLAGFISGLNRVYIDCDKKMVERLYKAAKEISGLNVIKGVIASGDQFISLESQRNRIISEFHAAAAEMEGASIGHVCAMSNVPFAVMRAISDGANHDSAVDFPTFAKMAAKNSIDIILKLLNNIKD